MTVDLLTISPYSSNKVKTCHISHQYAIKYHIWRFPKMVGTSKSSISFSDFPWNKPSSDKGVPPFMDPPIWEKSTNLHHISGPSPDFQGLISPILTIYGDLWGLTGSSHSHSSNKVNALDNILLVNSPICWEEFSKKCAINTIQSHRILLVGW